MLSTYARSGFDNEAFSRSEYGINASRMQYFYMRFKDAPMHPAVTAYWNSCGVRKEVLDLSENEDRVYSLFTPLDMAIERKYPLLCCFCDKADDYFKAETYGYTELSGREKFICVYPEYKAEGLPDLKQDFEKILSDLRDRNIPVDYERMYAAGFFYGASAAVKLALTSPGVFAGVGLFCGSHIFRGNYLLPRLTEYENQPAGPLPLICVGGSKDARNIWPLEQNRFFEVFNKWMETAAHMKDFRPIDAEKAGRLREESDDPVKREFGLDFSETFVEEREGMEWYVGDYTDPDGSPAARFIDGLELPHIHCRSVSYYIWDYLKNFRRED